MMISKESLVSLMAKVERNEISHGDAADKILRALEDERYGGETMWGYTIRLAHFWVNGEGLTEKEQLFHTRNVLKNAVGALDKKPGEPQSPHPYTVDVARFLKKKFEMSNNVEALVLAQTIINHATSSLKYCITLCRAQFARYAELHRAKGTPESDLKAAANEEMADLCAGILSGSP